jgi:hypothetical protein
MPANLLRGFSVVESSVRDDGCRFVVVRLPAVGFC